MDGILSGKRVLVTGGTGSLGSTLVRRLLCGHVGRPASLPSFHVTRLSSTRCGWR
jgi:FlaA1/EpsC-like NDP-sugar epimerase